MKNFCAVFALFCVVFLFAACSGGSKESVYGDTDTSDSTSDKTDSDTTDTNSDDADSQSDSTADTTPDNGDSADDSEGDKPDSDNPDTTPDGGDTAPDNGDTEPDNGDSADDANTSDPADDADSSDSQSDDDADTSHGNEPEVGETREADCTGLPANASWNTVSSITQTWNGTEWVPSAEATFSTTESTTKCRFVCNQNYSWNDSECVAETRRANCESLPENAVWNVASSITQTWNGSEWLPVLTAIYSETPSNSECFFKCAENYEWKDYQCIAKTIESDCVGLPLKAHWNTANKIMQTWNGNEWIPSNVGSFNVASSDSECYFQCDEHYSWNSSTSKCDADSQPATCIDLPDNAVWNNVSEITQTWNGIDWAPSNIGSFNNAASTSECYFKCKEHYTWNSLTSICDADSQPAVCIGLPENAFWNNVSEITQTWNGIDWIPSVVGTYNETASSEECRFKCAEDYHWEDSACVSNTRRADCADLPTGAVRNIALSIIQNWTVENGWQPSTTPTYNTEESTNECRYKCDPAYTWENGNCINQKAAGCTELPENAEWNIVSEISQNWTGSEWIPTTTGTFSTSASTEECVFKCKEHYSWTDSICKAESRVSNCEELPAHARWNTAETISQTWDGLDWAPSTIGTYGEDESTTECRFKCDNYYQWNGALCVVPLARICTGQLRCFNDSREISCPVSGENFFGQDANYANLSCTWPSLTVDDSISDQKTLIDNNTGLEWQQTSSENNMAWNKAVSYCDELNYGGHDDWRLPTPQELLTLSAIIGDTDYFQATTDRAYWSSGGNCSPGYSSYAWYVDYYNYGGNYFIQCSGTSHKARCVRGNKLAYPIYEEIFSVSGNIIKDPINNLRWQKDRIEGKTWQEALSYCEGHGMRLPNINELASLINYETNISNFPGSIGVDWSSTTFSNSSSGSSAMMIKSNGTIDFVNKNEIYVTKTRCVVSLDEEK